MLNCFNNDAFYDDFKSLKDNEFNINNISKVEVIHSKNESVLYRFKYHSKAYIAKCFKEDNAPVEINNYSLLMKLGILTLPVFSLGKNIIVIEDLNSSSAWRLATKEDINIQQTGAAVAEWYLKFHAKGREYLSNINEIPGFLKREVDEINEQELYGVGQKLDLATNSSWKLAVSKIETLKEAIGSLIKTFNYNDFHWTNLALSRESSINSLKAIIFDYHLMGRGYVYSDCRNVAYSLGPAAREAFWQTYGPYDEKEKILDEPISILHSLYSASNRPIFPKWGMHDLEKVQNGQFEKSLQRALEIL